MNIQYNVYHQTHNFEYIGPLWTIANRPTCQHKFPDIIFLEQKPCTKTRSNSSKDFMHI